MDHVSRYHPLLVALHWVLALLVIAALALGALVMAHLPNTSPMKLEALRSHMIGGVLILLLMLVRLVVRNRSRRPRAAPTGSAFLDRVAWASHRMFYPAVDQNAFVEQVLPGGTARTLSEDEMAAYRAPFAEREARLPTLIWPRQIPIDGEPADVTSIVRAYGTWLSESPMPKLFVAGDPGAIIAAGGASQAFCRTWPNQREVTVKGRHFLPEDSPDEIGAALRRFVTETRHSALNPRVG